jgi:hypothetical protein
VSGAGRWIAVTVPAYLLIAGGLHFPGSLDAVGPEVGPLVFGAVTGLLLGGAQLVAFRGRLAHRWRWPVATAVGMAIAHGVGDGLSPDAGYLPVAIVAGLGVGGCQAVVVRRASWAVATAVALGVGIFGGQQLAYAMGFNSIFEQDITARHVVMTAASAMLYALCTAPIFARIGPDPGLPILAAGAPADAHRSGRIS